MACFRLANNLTNGDPDLYRQMVTIKAQVN